METKLHPTQSEFLWSLDNAVRNRVLGAIPRKVLSQRDYKIVEVVEELDRQRFVRRSYTPNGLARIKQSGLSYPQAWNEMNRIFGSVGIEVVPSTILYSSSGENSYPVVVASEYVDAPIQSASLASKKKLAAGLGNLVNYQGRYLPLGEMFMEDMFRVKNPGLSEENIVLIDTDPYLFDRSLLRREYMSAWYSYYMERISSLMWDRWLAPREREVVMRSFIKSAGEVLKKSDDIRLWGAVQFALMMSNGFDPRTFK